MIRLSSIDEKQTLPVMPIIEDDVKRAMVAWLTAQGCQNAQTNLGTRQGVDVSAIRPTTRKEIRIECKGEASVGSQHARSWPNVASAMLTSLHLTEEPNRDFEVGVAFPDTPEYRGRMALLQQFCKRQEIAVFWVSSDGGVRQW